MIASDSTWSNSETRGNLRILWLAGAGACVGVLLGFLSAWQWIDWQPQSDDVVARVNDVDILAREYRQALSLFASEKRYPLTENDRQLVLRRLIEEELLVQQGLSRQLVRRERKLRVQVIQSLMNTVTTTVTNSATATTRANSSGGEDTPPVPAETVQDIALRDYLEQLRREANIQWVNR